jgi:hypothetical protein
MPRKARQLSPAALLLAALLAALTGAPAIAQPSFELLDSGQWTFNKDCIARGDTLAAALTYGVQFWDLSDPAAPAPLGDYYALARKTTRIDWLEDLLALTTQDGWLQIVDAGDPGALVVASNTSGFGTTPDPLLQRRGGNRYCFVAGSTGLKCLDLANPAAPLLRGSLNGLGGSPRGLVARGDTLFVLAGGYGLHAVATNNVNSLALLDSEPLAAAQLLDIAVDGARLAVAAHDDGVFLLDAGDAADPVLVTQLIVDLGAGPLAVKGARIAGTLLFCAVDETGLVVYDISNLASPQLLGTDGGDWYSFDGLSLNGGRAYLNYWDGAAAGVQIFDLATPAAPLWLGSTAGFDYCRNVAVHSEPIGGTFVYTATGHQGVFAHELVGEELILRGQLPVINTWAVTARGSAVYIASANEGLSIGDFSDPEAPTELGSLYLGLCRDVQLSGDVAFVGVFGLGLAAVDVSDPANPVLLDQVNGGYQTVGVAISGTVAATADRAAGVNLWDISDPTDIRLLGTASTGGTPAIDVAFRNGDNLLYAAAGAVRVIDIANLQFPVQVGSFSGASEGVEIGPDGYLYVARDGAGVSAFDLSNPLLPTLVATYDTADNAHAVATAPGLAFVADHSALIAFRTGDATVAPSLPVPAALALAAHPNPFNPRTELVFSLPAPGRLRVEVFDLGGRRVARLAAGDVLAGEQRLRWDAEDDAGRGLPSGVYLARIELENAAGIAVGASKLVLIR